MTSYNFTIPLKSVGTAYLWWFFFGGVGAHKFYLNRPGMGVLYMFTLGIFFVGNLIDLFTLPSQVRSANEKLAREFGGYCPASNEQPIIPEAGLHRPDIDFEKYRTQPAPVQPAMPLMRAEALQRPAFGRRNG